MTGANRRESAALLEGDRTQGRWDVTLGEDACRVRSGAAPQVLAALRNAVVYLLSKVTGAKSRPEAIERLQIDPQMAKELIGISSSE